MLFISVSVPAQWYKVNSGISNHIRGMVFANLLDGYAITDSGKIIKTINGGNTWSVFYQDTSLFYQQSIVATNDSIFCFGEGLSGDKVKVSIQKGSQSTSIETIYYNVRKPIYCHNKIWFLNPLTSGLYTYDNGILDTMSSVVGAEDYSIVGDKISVSFATKIYTSDDFGQIWHVNQFYQSTLSSGPYQSYYKGSDTLVATTHYPTFFHRSDDNGVNWVRYHAPYITCYFTKSKIWGLSLLQTDKKIIYSSTDYGQTFQTDTLADTLDALYFYTDSIGFAFGENGAIYKTTNSGGITSINETLRNKLHIFPNPAKGNIKIEVANGIIVQFIRLITSDGKLIKEQHGNLQCLSVENVSAGNYLLEVHTNEGVVTDKIMLQ